MIDSETFRNVMANYPTGVCVVSAIDEAGLPCGLVIGSFTSVSLNPPLVGFFPGKNSGSWPLVQAAGKFCINILGSDQLAMCQQLATSGPDKFAGISHAPSGNGSPLLDNVIAWIDCDVFDVVEAGDHWFVMGRVQRMDVLREGDPLLFYRGQYGGFRDIAMEAD
jgi:3-hydroxy-9,10-secoandrosta-1,3,5(10)-triene-9,17-dione monooxygenase reductase component